MGRFYQTTAPEFVDDAMFKLPYEQMGAILLAKDAKVGGDIETTTALGDLLKAQGLDPDKPRLNQKIKEYEDSIYSTVDYIKNNALNYDPTEISKLQRTINEDFTRGEIAAIQGNKAAFDSNMAMWRKMQEKQPELYNDNYINSLASESLRGYKGVDYKGPSQYNSYKGLDATGMPNINDWVDKALKEALPDLTSVTKDTDTGRWLVTQGTTTKEMSEQDLNTILQTRLGGDVDLQNALKQRSTFGLEGFTNLYDEKGELAPTIQFNEAGSALFADNLLGNAFKSGIEKFGFKEQTTTKKMSETDRGKQDYAFALARKKEIEDNPFISVEGKDHITTFTGHNLADFATFNQAYYTQKAELIRKAEEIFMKANKIDMATFKKNYKKSYDAIQAGKFELIGNTPEIRSMQKELKRAQFEQSLRNATLKEIEETKLNGQKFNPKNPKHVKILSDELKTRGRKEVKTVAGWDIVPEEYRETPAGVASIQKQALPILKNSTLNLPKGTFVTIKGKKYDLSDPRYNTINKMIDAGIIDPEKIKVGEALSGGTATESGGMLGQTLVATFADGQKINFDLSEKSLMPVKGASNKVQFQVNGSLAGRTFTTALPDMSTEKLRAFNNDPYHKALMTGEHVISRIGNNSVPINENVTYHGGQGQKKRLAGAKNYKAGDEYEFEDGWIEVKAPGGGYEIHSVKEPIYKKALYEHFSEMYD